MSNNMKDAIANADVKTLDLFNPFADLTARQRIALASKWAMLKQGEQDTLAEFAAKGYDAATLMALYSLRADADSKIFSDNRAKYIATMVQWFPSLISTEQTIKQYAVQELANIGTETSTSQQLALLSAVKSGLLKGRTFLPEAVEKAFRALCRLYGYDISAVK